MLVPFNVHDDIVRVRLTDCGMHQMRRQSLLPCKTETEGWSQFRLLDLMNVFDGYPNLISPNPVPFLPDVLVDIDPKDLPTAIAQPKTFDFGTAIAHLDINSTFKIKLTDVGKEYMSKNGWKLREEDAEGRSEWHLWELMEIIGPLAAQTRKAFIATDVLVDINPKDLPPAIAFLQTFDFGTAIAYLKKGKTVTLPELHCDGRWVALCPSKIEDTALVQYGVSSCFCLFDGEGRFLINWLPTQEQMLATNWMLTP